MKFNVVVDTREVVTVEADTWQQAMEKVEDVGTTPFTSLLFDLNVVAVDGTDGNTLWSTGQPARPVTTRDIRLNLIYEDCLYITVDDDDDDLTHDRLLELWAMNTAVDLPPDVLATSDISVADEEF